jgi:hypothetical protein
MLVEKLAPMLPHGVNNRSVDHDRDIICFLGIEANIGSVIETPPRRHWRAGLANFANAGDDGLGNATPASPSNPRAAHGPSFP